MPTWMKLLMRGTAVLVALALLGAAGMAFYLYGMPVYSLKAILPEFPDALPVYRLQIDVTQEYVAGLAARLGLKGEVGRTEDGLYRVSDPVQNKSLTADAARGSVEYLRTDLTRIGFEAHARLPDFEQARAEATSFLQGAGLLPPGVAAATVTVGASAIGVPTELLVVFKYLAGQAPVFGDDTAMSVRIGPGGVVLQMTMNVSKYSLADKMPFHLKPVSQAYSELKQTGRAYTAGDSHWVRIEAVSLVYLADASPSPQQAANVYPVYKFTGRYGRYFGSETSPYTGLVTATYATAVDMPAAAE